MGPFEFQVFPNRKRSRKPSTDQTANRKLHLRAAQAAPVLEAGSHQAHSFDTSEKKPADSSRLKAETQKGRTNPQSNKSGAKTLSEARSTAVQNGAVLRMIFWGHFWKRSPVSRGCWLRESKVNITRNKRKKTLGARHYPHH